MTALLLMLSAQDTHLQTEVEGPSVYAAALQSHQRGWSLIPLIGGSDPQMGKRPAIRWEAYQHRLSSGGEINHWFEGDPFTAYGIVCGAVSRLVVLDFDDLLVQAEFEQRFPQFMQTFTVQSGFRKTAHLYFNVDFRVKTCKLRGGDLKGEGSYVVGPGSTIAGHQWKVIRDLPLLTLQPDGLEHILSFLALPKPQLASSFESANAYTDFAQLYIEEVARTGERNNALFNMTRKVRDGHLDQQQAVELLAHLHAFQIKDDRECYETRYAEAVRTIASVYRQPPQRSLYMAVNATPDEPISRLPNSIREALLKVEGGVCFLRTYEGLLLSGFTEGKIITRKQMFSALKSHMSEYAIKIALHLTTPNGQRLFVRVDPSPSPRPPSLAYADPDGLGEKDENKCFVDQQKSSRSPQARPAHRPPGRYRLPTIAELCEWLGVKAGVSDPIQLEDVGSAKVYRKTLERELIQRQPGQYPQGWLADRLGVTPRSIYTYHQEIPIHSQPCYTEQELTWENYEQALPTPKIAKRAGIDIRGRFLEDERGKRYPAKVGIAQKLLGQKRRVWLKQRTFNFYWYETYESSTDIAYQVKYEVFASIAERDLIAQQQFEAKIRLADERMQAFFVQQSAHIDANAETPQLSAENGDSEAVSPFVPNKTVVPRNPPATPHQFAEKQPLLNEEAELLARAIHKQTALNGKEHTISLNNARILIQTYGIEAVKAAFSKMRWLQKNGKINNPAGFMITASRISWRIQNGATWLGAPAPRFRGEKGRQAKSQR